jgi:sulfonate transport system permease protein
LLLGWAIGSETGLLADNVLASPLEVARTAASLTASGVLWHHLSLSFGRAALGLLAGGGLGLTLGMAAGLSKLGEELLDPTVQMVRSIPFLALVPLFIVWFGIGETAKVLLIAAAAAKPMYLNAFGGARSVDPKILEAARVYGVTRWRQVLELYLPSALPSLMVGLRLSMSMSLIALIAVEVINTSRGIGFLMLQAQEFFKTGILVVCIVLYALLGLGTDLLVRLLEAVFIPWRRRRTGLT